MAQHSVRQPHSDRASRAGRVGKTSIVLRYIRGQFSEAQQSTLQASYLDKTLTVNGQTVALSIWDTAGQERFHALGPIYYRDADGALLVYDITHADSFERVKHWVKELRSIVGSQIVIAIAGNKIDLEKSRAVEQAAAVGCAGASWPRGMRADRRRGPVGLRSRPLLLLFRRTAPRPASRHSYTKSVDASHFSTSAKLNRGLDAAFLDITKRAWGQRWREGWMATDPVPTRLGAVRGTAQG